MPHPARSVGPRAQESEERACKPDSVGGGHFSGEPVTRLLVGLTTIPDFVAGPGGPALHIARSGDHAPDKR